MLVKREQVAGMDALLNVVARYGEATSAEGQYVTIALGASAYRFQVGTRSPQEPLVVLASITAMTPDALPEPVLYAQSKLFFMVDENTASRITATLDRFGQCVWCASYGHSECVARTGGQCLCACGAEWAAVSAAQMAMEIMMQAPPAQQPAAWGGPCLCACQMGQDCQECGHLGCGVGRVRS